MKTLRMLVELSLVIGLSLTVVPVTQGATAIELNGSYDDRVSTPTEVMRQVVAGLSTILLKSGTGSGAYTLSHARLIVKSEDLEVGVNGGIDIEASRPKAILSPVAAAGRNLFVTYSFMRRDDGHYAAAYVVVEGGPNRIIKQPIAVDETGSIVDADGTIIFRPKVSGSHVYFTEEFTGFKAGSALWEDPGTGSNG